MMNKYVQTQNRASVISSPPVSLQYSSSSSSSSSTEPTVARPLRPRPPLCSHMEAKAKTGTAAPKGAAVKAEKKEPAAPRKPDPAPVEPETESPPSKDDKAETDAPTEAEEAATPTDCLEHLKPFLIGGAVVAVGAVLLGVLLLARRH